MRKRRHTYYIRNPTWKVVTYRVDALASGGQLPEARARRMLTDGGQSQKYVGLSCTDVKLRTTLIKISLFSISSNPIS